MPNRIIRESILDSERVNLLDWAGEVFYRRLLSIVDDFGRYDGRAELIRAKCYPLKIDRVSSSDVSSWIAACVKAGLVSSYEVDGKAYLQVERFNQQRRAKVSKYPQPPANAQQMRSRCAADDAHVRADAHLVVDVCVDEGACVNPPDRGGGFDRFWSVYPKKKDKGNARKVWKRLKCDAITDSIITAVEAQKRQSDWRKEGGQFIPYPATWLNGERWQDEIETPETDLVACREFTEEEARRGLGFED